jgi:beta-galactosidase
MKTGVCYYPEHWPPERWPIDAALMKQLGLSVIRVGEFAWSRLESADGQLHLDWLEEAIDTLHAQGLLVVLGTPTATPPRWMLDKYPDMLAVDAHGRTRDFGSRRHYCFSHEGYLAECKRIVNTLAKRFGEHPAIVGWQIDNEYGCHDTAISYSPNALAAFRHWCEKRYQHIDQLNAAWGNVFWSMEYDSFEQIGLPTGTVTECNPAHQLAYWRFSSDQIKRFNRSQIDILRKLSPGRDMIHNYMGNFVDFDHHSVSEDLDVASWDNYPLGFLSRDSLSTTQRQKYLRTGHPDGSAFHHDLYRGCCQGRWWVMEQQPGPVNWAPYNPAPLPGMVRLWGWEAFAHGAEVMSYFRWRQAPFAQEQTHTGLLLPNADEDVAAREVATLNREIAQLLTTLGTMHGKNQAAQKTQLRTDDASSLKNADAVNNQLIQVRADIALVFSYDGLAVQNIQSFGGQHHDPLGFCQQLYGACRQWGLSVDIVSPSANLENYKLILLSTCTVGEPGLVEKLVALKHKQQTTIALFPGTGSRTPDYSIPDTLPPGTFQELIDIAVIRSETLPRQECQLAVDIHKKKYNIWLWREHVRSDIPARMGFSDGWGFHYEQDQVHYFNAIPLPTDLTDLIGELIRESGLRGKDLGPDLRTQRNGTVRIAVNYGAKPVDLDLELGPEFQLHPGTKLIVGNRILAQAEVAVWVVE